MGDLDELQIRAIRAGSPGRGSTTAEIAMAEEILRSRAEHEAIRSELPQLSAFVAGGESSNRFPKTAAAIERILAAWIIVEDARHG